MVMMIEKLKQLPFLDGLDDVALADIAIISTEFTLDDGEVLIGENEPENHLYFLCEGQVEVTTRENGSTSGELVLSNEDVEVFGEIGWLCNSRRSANVCCVGKTVAIQVDGPRLMKYLEDNPRVGFLLIQRIARLMAARLKKSDLLIKQMLLSSGV